MSSNLIWPSEGSLVVGPIDPATNRGLSLLENCCATSLAILAAAMFSSATLSCKSYSARTTRSEEHTSELQSQSNLVCRLLLEKKKNHIATCVCTHQHSIIVRTA